VTFHVPPIYQGQVVELAYALTPLGVVERIHDRSDRTRAYQIADWTPALERWSESVGPWNSPPPRVRWRKLTAAERRELEVE
jgi:hypothetical protein